MTSIVRPPAPASESTHKDMVWLPGGAFLMGSDDHYPEEAPVRQAHAGAFWIDAHAVTNAEFRRFVKATGYVTLAELPPDPAQYPGASAGLLVPGSAVFRQPRRPVDLRNHYNWWTWQPGADWRHPEGPGSTLHGRERHPVVHVAFDDALAYARWAGKSLPNEAEWEFAARGGLVAAEYVWGNDFAPRGRLMANTWQGEFPVMNLASDGFAGTSPVASFPPNGYGLFDMAGNVWEWTVDTYRAQRPSDVDCCGTPPAPVIEERYDVRDAADGVERKVIKGGSYLCAPNYCRRYRPAARMHHPVDTATCHIGFRCIIRDDIIRDDEAA
jgi:formylglycine-generating enzyme required for sulfatase activity